MACLGTPRTRQPESARKYGCARSAWREVNGFQLLYTIKGGVSTAFSPDSKKLILTGKSLGISNAANGQVLMDFSIQLFQVFGAAFSPDGKKIVTVGQNPISQPFGMVAGLGYNKWQAGEGASFSRVRNGLCGL